MSRTDAHMPWWVIADWYEPYHDVRCEHSRWGGRRLERMECTLPERAVRHRARHWPRVLPINSTHCTWEPVWPRWRQARYLHVRNVPKWYVDHVWHNRERTRQRTGLRTMINEYNTHGELDDGDFPSWQARHCATWYWD